jgi:hypothetical protein
MNTPNTASDSPSKTSRSGHPDLHAAASSGLFEQIPEAVYTREVLLPPSVEGQEHPHFLETAKQSGHLEKVPGAVWVRLQKLQSEKLSEAEEHQHQQLMALHAELVALYCSRLEAHPGIYHREIPPDFKNDPTIRALHRKHELKDLEKLPIPFEQLPQRFQQGQDAFEAWSRPWIQLLANDTHPFDKIPEKLRQNEEALEAWRRPWIQRLGKAPIDSYLIPPELRQNAEAVEARKQHHCNAVRAGDENALRTVPKELRELPELLEAMTEGWSTWFAARGLKGWDVIPESFRHTERLQNQAAALWIDRIKHESFAWTEVPRELSGVSAISSAWMDAQPVPAQMEPSFAEIASQPNLTKVTLQLWRNSNHWNRQKTGAMLIELRGKPWLFEKLNAAAQSHPMIHEAAIEGAQDMIGRNANYFHVLPTAFRTEHQLLDQAAADWLADLKAERCTWEHIPASLQAAPSLVHWKEKQESTLRKLAREQKQATAQGRLRANPELRDEELTKKELKSASIRKLRASYWAKKVEKDKMLFLEVPESLIGEEVILKFVRAHWGPLIHKNPAAFESLPDRVKADEGIQRVYKIATRAKEDAEGSAHHEAPSE